MTRFIWLVWYESYHQGVRYTLIQWAIYLFSEKKGIIKLLNEYLVNHYRHAHVRKTHWIVQCILTDKQRNVGVTSVLKTFTFSIQSEFFIRRFIWMNVWSSGEEGIFRRNSLKFIIMNLIIILEKLKFSSLTWDDFSEFRLQPRFSKSV